MKENSDFTMGFLSGDPKILREIYQTHYKRVENYIRSHDGSKTEAKDVFHNALILIYVKLKEDTIRIELFENYLFTVCRNLWRREKSKKRVTNIDDLPLEGDSYDLAAFYIEQRQWDLYQEKLKSLGDQCKAILKMIFENKSYDEIVTKFQYSSKTVARQRVFKCKTRLTNLIQKDARYARLLKEWKN
jgi:RNA polymerase sigma factor (sigma-70 family)